MNGPLDLVMFCSLSGSLTSGATPLFRHICPSVSLQIVRDVHPSECFYATLMSNHSRLCSFTLFFASYLNIVSHLRKKADGMMAMTDF